MRLLHKNIAMSSLMIALALIIGVQKTQAQCTTVASCDNLGFNMDVSKCDTAQPILKCPSDTNKAFCTEKANCIASSCAIGSIFYSDKTCSNSCVLTDKTPIGIVFDATNKLVVALNETQVFWSSNSVYIDIPNLNNYTNSTSALEDMDGKGNTNKMIEYQSSSGEIIEAADYCYNYVTAGTNKRDWFLPSAGQFYKLYWNQESANTSLGILGKPKLSSSNYWSSSEYNNYSAWIISFSGGSGSVNYDGKGSSRRYVRPVLAF